MNIGIITIKLILFITLLSGCRSIRTTTPTLDKTPLLEEGNNITITETNKPITTETKEIKTPTPFVTTIPSSTSIRSSIGDQVKFLYEQDNKIWFWLNDKRTELISVMANRLILYSPDGLYFVYNKNIDESGFFDLWSSDMKGSEKQIFSSSVLSTIASPGLGLEWPQVQVLWIPGTHNLLLNDYSKGGLFIINVESGEYHKIAQFPQPGMISISPNGAVVVLISKDSLFRLDLDTFEITKINSGFPSNPEIDFSINHRIAWLDDTNNIRLVIPIMNKSVLDQTMQIFDINLNNGEVMPITRIEAIPTQMKLSPKGDWLVYIKADENSDQDNFLHAFHFSDNSDTILMSDIESILSWSGDEKKLAVRSRQENLIIDRILFLDNKDSYIEIPRPVKFISWLDSNRYFNSHGEIRNTNNGDFVVVINDYQFNPFDFIVQDN